MNYPRRWKNKTKRLTANLIIRGSVQGYIILITSKNLRCRDIRKISFPLHSPLSTDTRCKLSSPVNRQLNTQTKSTKSNCSILWLLVEKQNALGYGIWVLNLLNWSQHTWHTCKSVCRSSSLRPQRCTHEIYDGAVFLRLCFSAGFQFSS